MKILFLLLISISLVSCGSFGDAKKVLKNEKIRNTDEFLVKKKEPLELPPDFSDIPKPDTLKKDVSKNAEDKKIRKMLNAANKEQENEKKFSSTEDSILNKIRK
jgi:hypothetical protein